MIEHAIRLGFKASNNEVKYKALIARLKLAVTVEAGEVVVFCDSQLIVNQATGRYATWDERMIAYVKEIVRLLALFQDYRLQQSNRQTEASNKTILDGIKRRLEAAKGKWVEELPNVLWTYQTMLRRSAGEFPFAMAYGIEAVIPLEVDIPGIRSQGVENGIYEAFLTQNLDLTEQSCDDVSD
ncbi:uncharacterized protein LOC114294455 [Camellia sinensis]|uniref:uncharacterized protein LOC114294455 n=1 Tax=Camellia sinensis TaxID=4442 RepID=UPI0010362527|nr:uncharacterized protein LOC114294455 [Camellia sinensis]